MAMVYTDQPCFMTKFIKPVELKIQRWCNFSTTEDMDWKQYIIAMLYLNLIGFLVVYALQRLQVYLPLNPQAMPAVNPDLAFNTAISFITNTNWQAYSGENTMAYITQNLAFTVQHFLSAATGMSILVAFIRGLARQQTSSLGNFWVDITRSVLYILLPLAIIFSITLVSQGVIQNYKPYQTIELLAPATVATQTIPMGPVASQEAIKILGSNGGGFFNANSAHPFENPNLATNFLAMLTIILLPAAFCYTFGVMAQDRRQGWMILVTMLLIFIPAVMGSIAVEQRGNPILNSLTAESAGNMEGKETRFGIINSAIWATATTATSNGSVNAMHDSLMPITNLICLTLMHLGEIIFGGIGSGLYGMLVMVMVTVFIAGLMIGRTPEYLGKKIEPFEMKMIALIVLVMPLVVIIITALASVTKMGTAGLGNPGAQGLMEILYAFTSLRNNNGSALAGLNSNSAFYNITGGILMLIGRYWVAIATLAIAGSMANKKLIPPSSGTLATHNWLFIMLLLGVIFILGALSLLPILSLGPIVEHLLLWENYGN